MITTRTTYYKNHQRWHYKGAVKEVINMLKEIGLGRPFDQELFWLGWHIEQHDLACSELGQPGRMIRRDLH